MLDVVIAFTFTKTYVQIDWK